MNKAEMLLAIGGAANFPPIARALAYAALLQAGQSEVEKISEAISKLGAGMGVEATIDGLGLDATGKALVMAYLKANPAIFKLLDSANGTDSQLG